MAQNPTYIPEEPSSTSSIMPQELGFNHSSQYYLNGLVPDLVAHNTLQPPTSGDGVGQAYHADEAGTSRSSSTQVSPSGDAGLRYSGFSHAQPQRSVPAAISQAMNTPSQLSLYQRRMSSNGSKKITPLCAPTLLTATQDQLLALYSPTAPSSFNASTPVSATFSAPHTPYGMGMVDMANGSMPYSADPTYTARHFHPYLPASASPSPTDGSFSHRIPSQNGYLMHTPTAGEFSGFDIGFKSGAYLGPDDDGPDDGNGDAQDNGADDNGNVDPALRRRINRRRERNRLAARRSREKRTQYITDLQTQNALLSRQYMHLHQQFKVCVEELSQYRRLYPSPVTPGFAMPTTPAGVHVSMPTQPPSTIHGQHQASAYHAMPPSPAFPSGLVSPSPFGCVPPSPGYPYLLSQPNASPSGGGYSVGTYAPSVSVVASEATATAVTDGTQHS